MSVNETAPSPHTTPEADEWLATWIALFGMFFVLFIFLAPWLFFTDDPVWGGAPSNTIVRYVRTVPVAPVAPAPPPKAVQPPQPTLPYQQVVQTRAVLATSSCMIPDLSHLQGIMLQQQSSD